MVASGAIPRSTEEWLMSRSCQSATCPSAAVAAERIGRAGPVRFSVRIGLRLCGMADEPFWPEGLVGHAAQAQPDPHREPHGPGAPDPLRRHGGARARSALA